MTRRVVLAALACALLVPASAHAGTPFTIGEGSTPNVYTQADNGTGHVVWQNEAGTITYCQVPRGATACTETENLGAPADAYNETFLVRTSATQIYAVMPVYASSKTFRKVSNDNGLTWSGTWQQIYQPTGTGTTATQPFVLGGEFLVPVSGGVVYGAAIGAGESAVVTKAEFPNIGVDTAAVPLPGSSALLVGNDLATTRFRTLKPGFDPSDNASWNAETPIAGPLDSTSVTNGPSGVFLFGAGEGVGGGQPELRIWNDGLKTFDPPQSLSPSDIAYNPHVTAGPGGAVAAIWRRNGTATDTARLIMAISPSGAPGTFSLSTIAREDVGFSFANISLASDNAGWVAYHGQGGGATSRIRLVDTTTAPEPPAPPAPGGTPAPTPKPTPLPVKPAAPKKPTKTTSVTSNGAKISLGVPNACIPSGKPFVATLSWKKQKRKGNRFVKITRTDFYIGKARVKIDRKAPFRQTLRIPKPKKGQSYTLRARAFIKVKKTRRVPKKSVTTTLKVCS